jgi:hypothetical protein
MRTICTAPSWDIDQRRDARLVIASAAKRSSALCGNSGCFVALLLANDSEAAILPPYLLQSRSLSTFTIALVSVARSLSLMVKAGVR